MREQCVEGIVLKSFPCKEFGRVTYLFTFDRGIVTFFTKCISKNRPSISNLTSPLCRAEFVLQTKRSNLRYFIDGTILDLHLDLRQSYERLQCAGRMLNLILTSQMPEKPAPALYTLLTTYLKHLPAFSSLAPLWASFQLKLLKHEGLLFVEEICSTCSKVRASHLMEGESRCLKCAKNGRSFPFSEQDWKMLLCLFHARRINTLKRVAVNAELLRNIEMLYKSKIETPHETVRSLRVRVNTETIS